MKKKLNCVLLVDDNESDNFLHKRVLEKAGIANHIDVALNGQEALDFLIEKGRHGNPHSNYNQPELILLDINMPVMDGWEFLEVYNKLEATQKAKIVFIMLTTSLNPSDKVKAETLLDSNCFRYKPLTTGMINEIMENHFPEYL